MLQKLFVQNYALIDRLEVDFNTGLSIITGETGAGKSIILGALGLIAGNRAELQSLNDKTKKCIVEASFNIAKCNLHDFFNTNELDYEDITTIRREITPTSDGSSGKSRAFINDTPVNLTQLSLLSKQLIDIHSQHQTLTLNGSEFQLTVVDGYANNQELISSYQSDFKKLKELKKTLNSLIEQEIEAKKQQDYIQFQFDELADANLKTYEQDTLESELEILNNVELIKQNLGSVAMGLNGGDENLLNSFSEIESLLKRISSYTPEINELYTRINSTYIELKDICSEIEATNETTQFDPNRLDELNERLDLIFRLQQKHQKQTIEELLEVQETLNNQLFDFGSLSSSIEKTKEVFDKLEKSLQKKAAIISANRKKAIPKIQKDTLAVLGSLAMPNAQFIIEQTTTEELTNQGIDNIRFLFSANKGIAVNELHKVASGGELSRLMLSIKSLISKQNGIQTIIFDEIDTGVSGDVADKVGTIIKKMSLDLQVIAITHLPQMASKGNVHLRVFKEEKNHKTYSNMKLLSHDERVTEIATMLSHENPTSAAIQNAEELLKM